ncbi:MAG: type II toxin-antitoxin system VapC family toxin [Proteobacteria bacterium]|nr:type II toxin-antitoxin system VapC family toxin [Pseudomonadota bacterium]
MVDDSVFIDTSAFYALMDRSDGQHAPAAHIWTDLLNTAVDLKTSNYIVVETYALMQSRLGLEAAILWHKDILGVTDILWIDARQHNLAFELWAGLGRKKLSFVDCTSFAIMRSHHLDNVFGFDKHFSEQGFVLLG